MPKNLSAHVTSVLAFVTGLIAAIHPGFTINAEVQKIVVIAAPVVIVVMQGLHINYKTVWMKCYHEMMMQERRITGLAPAPLKPEAELAADALNQAAATEGAKFLASAESVTP